MFAKENGIVFNMSMLMQRAIENSSYFVEVTLCCINTQTAKTARNGGFFCVVVGK